MDTDGDPWARLARDVENWVLFWSVLTNNLNGSTRFQIQWGDFSPHQMKGPKNYDRRPSHSMPRNFETTGYQWVWPARLGGIRPLINREVIQVLGPPFWTSCKWQEISEHIVTDDLRGRTPSILRYWVFQHYIKLPMGSSHESSGVDEDVNPFSHPSNGAAPRIPDNMALYRAGAADEPARGVWARG